MSQPEAAIIEELRSARIAASPELRERVRAIAARPPEPPQPPGLPALRLPRFGLRRTALVLVPTCLAVALAASLAVGLATSGKQERTAAPTPAPAPVRNSFQPATDAAKQPLAPLTFSARGGSGAAGGSVGALP